MTAWVHRRVSRWRFYPHDLILSHWRCLDLLLDLVRAFFFGFSAARCGDSDGGMTTSDKGRSSGIVWFPASARQAGPPQANSGTRLGRGMSSEKISAWRFMTSAATSFALSHFGSVLSFTVRQRFGTSCRYLSSRAFSSRCLRSPSNCSAGRHTPQAR
jgi:hypothetical protein